MILYSSATPKQVKNYPFRRLLRGILCYHTFAKKVTMYKQSQEQQCWIWVEWSQELHNTQSFLPPVGIETIQSLLSKMAFTASCLPWNLKYSNTIIFLKKCLGQRLLPGQMVVMMVPHQLHHPLQSEKKFSIKLKPKLPIIYLLTHKWCVIKEHDKTKLVHCVISQKQIKNNTGNKYLLHIRHSFIMKIMRYINKK